MPAPPIIPDLIERFARNLDAYRSGQYNEAQVRQEFIDPFFKALGWDVSYQQGHAEAYKEVIHEDAIKIGGYTKAPDYCFRIGGTRKFFVILGLFLRDWPQWAIHRHRSVQLPPANFFSPGWEYPRHVATR